MALHARQIAIAAGAQTDEVDTVSAALVAGREIRVDRARDILAQIRAPKS
jgi:hydroxymethylglutaryl-CoA reductase